MPPRASTAASAIARPGLWLSLGAATLVGLSLAGGWWLGQRQGNPGGGDHSQVAVERQADLLRQRLADGSASEADQRRLLQLLLVLGQQQEATALLEQLADQQPQQWQLRVLLAELRRNGNDRSGAERELRQVLNLKPDRIEALQLLTLLQLEQGRGGHAQAQLKALMEKASKPVVQPQVLPIGMLLADLQQQQGQRAEAAALYLKLAADFPRDPRPLLALALLRQEQGDTKAAQEAMALARSRQPDKPDPRLDQVAASWGLTSLRRAALSPRAVSPAAPTPTPAGLTTPEPGPPAP
ncbi:MAG: tetratricopeptide repeat protein [Vulcanococcus sp.]